MKGARSICMVAVQHSTKDDRIYYKQARSLARAGFNVSVVTSNPSGVPMDMAGRSVDPGPDTYGISHYCVKEPMQPLHRLMKRYYTGPFYKEMHQACVQSGAHIFVAHEPQSIGIARKAAEATGGVYVFDSHESLYFSNGKDQRAMEREMKGRLDYFTTANLHTLQALRELNPSSRSEVIYNASILPVREFDPGPDPLIVHEGSLPFNRGLKLMLDAFRILKEQEVPFRFKIIGSLKGAEKEYFQSFCEEHGLLSSIVVTGWKPYEELGEHLRDASIGLIMNEFTPNNLWGGPANKLFNYIASNACVVSVDLPETKRIIEEHGCGIVLPERTAESLANTLSSLLQDAETLDRYRLRSHETHPHICWEEESKKLIRFYEEIASGSA